MTRCGEQHSAAVSPNISVPPYAVPAVAKAKKNPGAPFKKAPEPHCLYARSTVGRGSVRTPPARMQIAVAMKTPITMSLRIPKRFSASAYHYSSLESVITLSDKQTGIEELFMLS
ncbi:hypothetical protein RRF57_004454 [Xylaria bambusicola]|uniref:Uncharacterized protein n=1 Tax=Xylaria bambusicola TaxID=326684 RepID=A0AAN7UA92_9PEZI